SCVRSVEAFSTSSSSARARSSVGDFALRSCSLICVIGSVGLSLGVPSRLPLLRAPCRHFGPDGGRGKRFRKARWACIGRNDDDGLGKSLPSPHCPGLWPGVVLCGGSSDQGEPLFDKEGRSG